MRKACIIGFPVAHSLSPKLHNYWLKKYNIEGGYAAWEIKPENLALAISDLQEQKYTGCNLTLPHKELVLPMLDSMDDNVRSIGAANTIVVKPDGTLHGKNTDAFGFMENIRSHVSIKNKNKAVVLGAGGAAKAVVCSLAQVGFKKIVICNRSVDKAKKLAEGFSPLSYAPWEMRNQMLENTDLLVNATSLGMKGEELLSLDLSLLPKTAIVSDIVYTPLETELLKTAKARGNIAIDGLGMLIFQAVPAFEAWFGMRPEVTKELRDHLL